MTSQKILAQGAEAILTLENNQVTKSRIKKSYRISVLDEKLRKSRTKSEAKIINKLNNIIPVPKIISTDEKQTIIMQYIEGKKLSDNLEHLNYKEICKQIAENISKMHGEGIIHSDLTTSNMIYVENPNKFSKTSTLTPSAHQDCIIIKKESAKLLSKRKQLSNINQNHENDSANYEKGKVFFIDFGLSFHSNRIEDKAVDLHLLQQALEAKHFTIWQECWKIILKNYKPEKYKEIINRVKVIESRGRYKDKF